MHSHFKLFFALIASALVNFAAIGQDDKGLSSSLAVDLRPHNGGIFFAKDMRILPTSGHVVIRYERQGESGARLCIVNPTAGSCAELAKIKGVDPDVPNCRFGNFAVHPDERSVAFLEDSSCRIVPLPSNGDRPSPRDISKKAVRGIQDASGWPMAIGREGERGYALSAVYEGRVERLRIHEWKLLEQTLVQTTPVHKFRGASLSAATLSGPNQMFAASCEPVAGEGCEIVYGDLKADGKLVTVSHPHVCRSITLSADAKVLAAGFADGSLAWWNTKTNKLIKHHHPICNFSISAITVHPGGRVIICGSLDQNGHHNLFFIDLASGDVLRKVVADPKGVTALCVNATGNQLVTCGASGTLKFWELGDLYSAAKPENK